MTDITIGFCFYAVTIVLYVNSYRYVDTLFKFINTTYNNPKLTCVHHWIYVFTLQQYTQCNEIVQLRGRHIIGPIMAEEDFGINWEARLLWKKRALFNQ